MDNRDTYRSKNGFNFESDDSKFPYDGYQFYGTKKAAIFNYSNEVFRRKKASGAEGLYLIDGGNIPSDMADSTSYAAPPNSDDLHPVIACTLNKGTAGRLESVTAINLSPNRLPESPTPCVAERYPLPAINPEEGKDQKPNFMYMPMYQYSCSKHPRAAGLAHEDNYDCLKKPMNASNAEGFCCDAAAGCLSSIQFFQKSVGLDGKPVWLNLAKDFFEIFYCSEQNKGFTREECGYQNSCKAGFNKGFSVAPNGGCQVYGADCGCEIKGNTKWAPAAFGISRVYNITGNTDCNSCTSPGGIVYIDGYTDCFYCEQECWLLDPIANIYSFRCTNPDGTIVPNRRKRKCNEAVSTGKSQFCACNFTDKFDIGGTHGTIYYSSFQYPTNMFSNWAPIGLSGPGGTLASTSCNGEFVNGCDEVS